jgi:hypothetical protein
VNDLRARSLSRKLTLDAAELAAANKQACASVGAAAYNVTYMFVVDTVTRLFE